MNILHNGTTTTNLIEEHLRSTKLFNSSLQCGPKVNIISMGFNDLEHIYELQNRTDEYDT